MTWEIVIGLETHTQLSTVSKIFSSASTAFGAPPNAQASAVDLALPGVLPVMNAGALERAVRFGLAVDGNINRRSVFARKHYFYPDLPKGYQISQYELPVVQGGSLTFLVGDAERTVRLTRAHLEEDAGKSLHEDFHGMTGIDLNRAGTPLLEIVSEPDMRSAAEAVAYAKTLHALVRWIGICDGNMQEGSFRCDANVSVRPLGSQTLGTRREIKNLNSFRFLEQAIEYEARWQIGQLEDGGSIHQATVLFDPASGATRAMRLKEDAHDYRYFPDPDLLPLEISDALLAAMRGTMPELPQRIRQRYAAEQGLSAYDAMVLTSSRELSAYFDEAVKGSGARNEADFKLCANWVINEVIAERNRDEGIEPWQFGVGAGTLGRLLQLLRDGTIGAKAAKALFAEFWEESRKAGYRTQGGDANAVDRLVEERGLRQLRDAGAIERIVDEVLAANPQQVADYRAGKEKAFNSLVGQAMKASRGKADPAQVNELLKKKLAG